MGERLLSPAALAACYCIASAWAPGLLLWEHAAWASGDVTGILHEVGDHFDASPTFVRVCTVDCRSKRHTIYLALCIAYDTAFVRLDAYFG